MSEFTPFLAGGSVSGSWTADHAFHTDLNTDDGDTGRLYCHNTGAGTSNAHGACTVNPPDAVGMVKVSWKAMTLGGPSAGNTFRIGVTLSTGLTYFGTTRQQSHAPDSVYTLFTETIDCTTGGINVGGSNAIVLEAFSNGQDSYYVLTYMKVETATHTITASSDSHSAFDQEGAIVVADAANLTLTATPSAGYRILDVLVDGVSVGDAAGKTSYAKTFTNVTTDHTISVTAYLYVNSSMTDYGERVTCVYDFSQNIEGYGLAQVMGPPGGFPWSTPEITNTGAMVRTWDGKLYGANDANGGATANGTIYQLESGLYDTPVKVLGLVSGLNYVTGSLVQSTGVITANLATDFRRVAVGAKVTGSGITGSATVTAKSSAGDSITVTGTLTGNTTNQPYTCWGREIEAEAFCIADRLDEIGGIFSGQRANIHYACPTGEVALLSHSYDLARGTLTELAALDVTGAASTVTHRPPAFQDIVELPSASRTGGPIQEFKVSSRNGSAGTDTLSRAEVWGVEGVFRDLEQYK